MNGRDDERHERAHRLMMGALDGELSAGERTELDRLLAADEALREEWERMQTVKEVTYTMTFRTPPDDVWDDYWTSVYNRTERGLGWLLLSAGLVVLFGWVSWHWVELLLADSGLPGFVKIAIFAVVFGGGILFVSVLREKLFTRRHDPYREVQR